MRLIRLLEPFEREQQVFAMRESIGHTDYEAVPVDHSFNVIHLLLGGVAGATSRFGLYPINYRPV